ncbi:uracil-DNA glycosylase (plasmid) [Trichlorobacter lovleyi]|uniref:uracil-DNA glycosylase n=1 Tax=Trichlorobacter lovleyi TaxID=313985 RepID=UPI003A102F37|nr:uracil-DNA glycosylase [Trichlorobacter lovleyi]
MDCSEKVVCEACGLSETRIQIVKGEGAYKKGGVVVIGEAPGGDEDEQGRPFVGAAGKILRRLMAEAGVDPSEVWITNIVKCRPPGNRRPTGKEKGLS